MKAHSIQKKTAQPASIGWLVSIFSLVWNDDTHRTTLIPTGPGPWPGHDKQTYVSASLAVAPINRNTDVPTGKTNQDAVVATAPDLFYRSESSRRQHPKPKLQQNKTPFNVHAHTVYT